MHTIIITIIFLFSSKFRNYISAGSTFNCFYASAAYATQQACFCLACCGFCPSHAKYISFASQEYCRDFDEICLM